MKFYLYSKQLNNCAESLTSKKFDMNNFPLINTRINRLKTIYQNQMNYFDQPQLKIISSKQTKEYSKVKLQRKAKLNNHNDNCQPISDTILGIGVNPLYNPLESKEFLLTKVKDRNCLIDHKLYSFEKLAANMKRQEKERIKLKQLQLSLDLTRNKNKTLEFDDHEPKASTSIKLIDTPVKLLLTDANESSLDNTSLFTPDSFTKESLDNSLIKTRKKKKKVTFGQKEPEIITPLNIHQKVNGRRCSQPIIMNSRFFNDNIIQKDPISKKAKEKTRLMLEQINELKDNGDYEVLDKNKKSFSIRNLGRIIQLKKIMLNKGKAITASEELKDNVTLTLDHVEAQTAHVLKTMNKLGPPAFFKTKFQTKTIEKYKRAIGLFI